MSRSGGTLKVNVQDVIGGDEHTIGLNGSHAERNGKVLDQDAVLVFHLRDGRVREVREFSEDTAVTDEFWS
jgi:ketosteroid isomerase-like protein